MRHLLLFWCGALAVGQQSQPQSRRDPEGRIQELVQELPTAPPGRAEQARRELLLFGRAATPALAAAVRERAPEAHGNFLAGAGPGPAAEHALVEFLATLRALGGGAEAAVPDVVPLLDYPSRAIRSAAREALFGIGAAGIPGLRHGLSTETDAVVAEIACLLQDLGARAATPDLRACLPECRPITRVAVLTALAALGEDSRWCIGQLVECLRDDGRGPFSPRSPESVVAAPDRAVDVLATYGEVATPALVQALSSPDERVRRNAAWALGRIRSAAAVPALRRGLLQEEASGQLTRLWALAQIGAPAAGAAPELVVLLRQQSVDPMLQQAVVRALVAGGAGVVRWMLPLCSDWDPELRRRAVGILGMLGAQASAAVPALVERLSDHNPSVAMAAAAALGRLGPAARDAVVPLLRDEQARRRELAALALESLGEQASAAAPQLAMGLGDPAEDARRACFAALAAMGAVGMQHLIQALTHPEPEVRRLAARSLGSLGPAASTAAPALVALVDHAEDAAAPDAAWALGQCGPLSPATAARLRAALAGPVPELRSRALEALVHGDQGAGLPIARVGEALRHADAQVRLAALRALHTAGAAGQAVLPAVVEAARDRDPAVQRDAVSWLGEFGPVEPDVVLALCAALQSPDRYVRFRALGGLSRDVASTRAILAGIRTDPQSAAALQELAAVGIQALAEPAWRR